MSYEINILCVGQTAPIDCRPAGFELKNEVEDEVLAARYADIWPVFSSTAGILYTAGKEWDCGGMWGAFPLCDSDFEHPVPQDALPSFLPEGVADRLTPLLLHPQYLPGLEDVVRRLVKASPRKTILFQTRYQGGDWELFFGTMTVDAFLRRMREGQLLFNLCYLVTEPDEASSGMARQPEDGAPA